MGRQQDLAEMRQRADELCRMVRTEDYPDVDVAIARQRLREFVEDNLPDVLGLYDMIYESRFDRLIEQFREPVTEDSWPGAR